MGILDKILGHNNEQTAQEKELMALIEQIRAFPCGEMVLDKIGLIDLTHGKLTQGTQIKVAKPSKNDPTTTFNLESLEETIERSFSIFINNRRILVKGRKIDFEALRDESYSQAFDVNSGLECSRNIYIREKNQTLINESAYRDDMHIEKVKYFRHHGPNPIDRTVDISFSPADISSLDALFSDFDDEKLFYWAERKNPWHKVEEKILASSHKERCGKFISAARGYDSDDLETILRLESDSARAAELLAVANSLTYDARGFNESGYPPSHGATPGIDRLGFRTQKTAEELLYETTHSPDNMQVSHEPNGFDPYDDYFS